jgi:hypothetical protein
MWCRELEEETQEKKDDVPNLNIHFYPSASRVIHLPVRGSKHFFAPAPAYSSSQQAMTSFYSVNMYMMLELFLD